MTLGQHGLATKRVFWTPKDLGAALILWLDGKNTASITVSSEKVSQWDDQSGNGNHATQATSSRQPKFTSGTEYIEFGANQETNLGSGITSSSRVESVLFVSRMTGASKISSTVIGSSASGGRQIRDNNYLSEGLVYLKSEIDGLAASAYGVSLNADYIGSAAISSSQIVLGNNGSRSTKSESTTMTASLTTRVGATSLFNNQSLTGRIYELIVTNTTLSSADLDRGEGYLAWRWGLQASLPAGHAYKNAPP